MMMQMPFATSTQSTRSLMPGIPQVAAFPGTLGDFSAAVAAILKKGLTSGLGFRWITMTTVLHLHIPRTGGISVSRALTAALGDRRDRAHREPADLRAALARGADVGLVSGHFHWGMHELLRGLRLLHRASRPGRAGAVALRLHPGVPDPSAPGAVRRASRLRTFWKAGQSSTVSLQRGRCGSSAVCGRRRRWWRSASSSAPGKISAETRWSSSSPIASTKAWRARLGASVEPIPLYRKAMNRIAGAPLDSGTSERISRAERA